DQVLGSGIRAASRDAPGMRRPTLVPREPEVAVQKRPEAAIGFRDITSRLSTLERAPIFFAFGEGELRAIARRLRRVRIATGEMVVCQGEPGDTIFFIERGRCRVVIEKPNNLVTVAVLSEGDFFGEGSAVLGRPQQASIYAQSECYLLALDRQSLYTVMAGRESESIVEVRRFAE